jgi:DDE superfamily endonuclease
VIVVDHPGFPRPSARTVAERERYPGPNGTRQIGHRSSWLSQLVDADSTWGAPLDVERIGPGDPPVGIALIQVARLAQHSAEPMIVVADREYGVKDVLRVVPQLPGVPITVVARVRSNLVFSQPPAPRPPGQKGAPRKYGARVQLNDPTTWPTPTWTSTEVAASGERIELRGWAAWIRRGIPQQRVQLVQVRGLRADGEPKYPQPLWLMVGGPRAGSAVASLYRQRWREETWHRQGKELLGWCRAQLGSVVRQDRWTWVVLLAAWQVLLVRELARDCPRPWERGVVAGPMPLARVQRDYRRIVRQFGLAAPAPKPRGKAPGRAPGTVLAPKPRQPVLRRRLPAA